MLVLWHNNSLIYLSSTSFALHVHLKDCSGLLCPVEHLPAFMKLQNSEMETRVASRAKVSSRPVILAKILASTFHLLYLKKKFLSFVLDIFLGVLKAVGHINDTLGPALIESVSAHPLQIRQLDDLEKQLSRTNRVHLL